MVNIEVLQKRAEKAQEYLEFLKEIGEEYSFTEFKSDKMIYGSSERFLHLAIETLLDIGNHIISSENLGSVDQYRDIPQILFENGYLDEQEKKEFIKIVGMRNILVHDYLEVEKEIVYKVLTCNLSDLEDILKSYLKLI